MRVSSPVPLRDVSRDQRNAFFSGERRFDDWLCVDALQKEASSRGRTFVALDDAGQVAGYYSLALHFVDREVSRPLLRHSHRALSAIYLSHLAVAHNHQGMGLGRSLFRDALKRACRMAEALGIELLVAHPVSKQEASFLKALGFSSVGDGPRALFFIALPS